MPSRSALDFGCGIGRLTQALAEGFERVVGVDIAPAMIEKAREANRFKEKCEYVVNSRDDLRMFGNGSFDFVISRIVLQHLPNALAESYLREFVRVLGAGGILVVQIPARRIRRRIRYFLSRHLPGLFLALRKFTGRRPRIPMHVIPRAEVERIVRESEGRVILVVPDGASGTDFESLVYYVMHGA